MKTKTQGLLLSLLAALILVQSALPVYAEKKKSEPPPPTIAKLNAAIPSLAALAESEQRQAKGGLRITVQQETYQAKESSFVSQREIAPPSFFGMVAKPAPNAVYIESTHTPSLTVSPDRLIFHLHISNQMSRVFRGSGIAVQFNVAGKVVSVDPSGYGDLVNVIIPPRGEQDITIVGPQIATIPAPSTVGLFLYDVVTNVDQAGNVTDKQNFEWYFSYQTQAIEREISVPAPVRSWAIPR